MAAKKAEEETTNQTGRVRIELFKDSARYKDDLPVIVNGKCWQIQRGVPVDVPEVVAEIIEQSLAQQRASTAYQEELQEEFNNQLRRLG